MNAYHNASRASTGWPWNLGVKLLGALIKGVGEKLDGRLLVGRGGLVEYLKSI